MLESTVTAVIRNNTQKLTSITWELSEEETCKDADFKTLQEAIRNGFPKANRTNSSTAQYWQYRDNLNVTRDVVIYNDQVVVPPSLRSTVLDALHLCSSRSLHDWA